jgi:hypothetical protein
MGEVKSVDYPTMDDQLSNEILKSSDRLKQKKWITIGCPTAKEAIFWNKFLKQHAVYQ